MINTYTVFNSVIEVFKVCFESCKVIYKWRGGWMFGKLQVSKEIREDRNVDESDKLAETLNNQSNRIEDFNDNQEVAGPSKVTSQSSTYF